MKRLRPREAQSPRLHGEFISSARMDQDAAVLIPAHASVGHQRNLRFPPETRKTKGGGGWVAQVGGWQPVAGDQLAGGERVITVHDGVGCSASLTDQKGLLED